MRRNIWLSNEAEEVLEQALGGIALSKFISEAILKEANKITQQSYKGLPPIREITKKKLDVCMHREEAFLEYFLSGIRDNLYYLRDESEFISTGRVAAECDASNDAMVDELKRILIEINHSTEIVPFFVYKVRDEDRLGNDALRFFFNQDLSIAMICGPTLRYFGRQDFIDYDYADKFGDYSYNAYELNDMCERIGMNDMEDFFEVDVEFETIERGE